MDSGWQKPKSILRQILENQFFSKILINKTSNFRLNLNHWSSRNFFEVLHASLAQKLRNPEFTTWFSVTLPLVTSWSRWSWLIASTTSQGYQMKAIHYIPLWFFNKFIVIDFLIYSQLLVQNLQSHGRLICLKLLFWFWTCKTVVDWSVYSRFNNKCNFFCVFSIFKF